jgi:hypothetical protein
MILLPKEIQYNEICQYLNCESIINLSRVNHDFHLINEDDILWKNLLYRDFGIEYEIINNLYILYNQDDVLYRDFENKIINIKNLYMLYKCALKKLSKVHPIITQRALLKVIEEIPKSEWDNLCMILKYNISIPEQHILSTGFLIGAINNSEYKNKFVKSDVYRNKLVFTAGNANLIWKNFDVMISIIENDYTKYKDLISKPTFIFIQNDLILCKYDYELAEQFTFELISNAFLYCHGYLEKIIEEIFNELRIKLGIKI